MGQMSQLPIAYGWWAWELKGYRSCHNTYCLFSYENLPPLPNVDPDFNWLTPSSEVVIEQEFIVMMRRKLSILEKEAAVLGLKIPDTFMRFMRSPELLSGINSGLGCWFWLGDHLVPFPGFVDTFLIGFLRDQQDSVVWCLCLEPNGRNCIVALPMDAVFAMSNYNILALQGDLDSDEGQEATLDTSHDKDPELQRGIDFHMRNVRICASTFEEFIYRFSLEDTIAWKLNGQDKTHLNDLEHCYLSYYVR